MRKIIKILVSIIIFCLLCFRFLIVHKDFTKSTYENIKNMSLNAQKTDKILSSLQQLPDLSVYKFLIGNNPDKKPVKIKFIKFTNPKFKDFDAVGYRKNNRLYIYINLKHKDAPIESLAALVAGRTSNYDTEFSLNEEVYSLFLESIIYDYYIRKNPNINNVKHPLVQREKQLCYLLKKADYSSNYIEKVIKRIPAYKNYPKSSSGFSDNELAEKLSELLRTYNIKIEDN